MGQKYDHEKFTLVWQNGESTLEVSEKTGLSVKQCAAKAAYLRRKGVNLKKMPRGRPENKAMLERCRQIVETKQVELKAE